MHLREHDARTVVAVIDIEKCYKRMQVVSKGWTSRKSKTSNKLVLFQVKSILSIQCNLQLSFQCSINSSSSCSYIACMQLVQFPLRVKVTACHRGTPEPSVVGCGGTQACPSVCSPADKRLSLTDATVLPVHPITEPCNTGPAAGVGASQGVYTVTEGASSSCHRVDHAYQFADVSQEGGNNFSG